MNWTEEQQLAIDQRNRNILVAAAAGSGKTAVLVERIKKLIIEDNTPIDRMLIVTFTNAAASEMKEKIRTAINKEIDRNPENSEKLRKQLDLMPRANISTFHSFALDVMRRFFYLCDVEPGFSIADEAQTTILREDAMDSLLDEWFEKDSSEFKDFLDSYSSDRNQKKIREIINTSYNTLMALPYPWKWMKKNVGFLSVSPEDFYQSDVMKGIWDIINETLAMSCKYSQMAVDTLSEAGFDSMAEKVNAELTAYNQMAEFAEARDTEALEKSMDSFPSVRLVAKKNEKEDYAEIKDTVATLRKKAGTLIKDMRALFFSEPMEDQISDMNKTASQAKVLLELLKDFDSKFKEAKSEKKIIDFNDIEHYCLDILSSSQAATFYRNKFKYIFIDEYQDTNILQEEIISKIKRADNMFMVGDIKQSIYKFRLAEPEIFREKYRSYANLDEKSVTIDLNQNFRSKSSVLAEINGIFENLMEDYDDKARLYPGLDYDGEYNVTPQMKVVDVSTVKDADDELAELRTAELEALEVCNIIKENLGRKFYDSKAGEERTLQLRDMVILMRGVKQYADIFFNILKQNGIEAFVDDNEGYFDTMEINVFMNLLSVIDNKLQDVPLISVLHSEIFDFQTDELAEIRAEFREGSYSEVFLKYSQEGKITELKEKCRAAVEKISEWKSTAGTMPLAAFIWKLLLETGYYLQMGTMPGGIQRQANLRALVDKAENFSADHQATLYDFCRYIDAVKKRNIAMGQVKLVGEKDNLVRIMTIHKSKGLEFPLVIVSGLGRKLNYTKVGGGVSLHKDIGIGMSLVNYNEHWYKKTLLQKLIGRQIHREEVQEEIRVLYVALTRAKDFLYMTGTVKDGEKYEAKRNTGIWSDTTYLDMIMGASKTEIVSCETLSATGPDSRENTETVITEELPPEKTAEIIRRLEFAYPYSKARNLKSKYSVSELNHNISAGSGRNFNMEPAVPKFRQGKHHLTPAERGTVYHGFMERMDFVRAAEEGTSYLTKLASEYVKDEIFTEEEIEAVNLNKILSFFDTPLGKNCLKAYNEGRLERERPFTFQMEYSGETVMVQGVIDCFFDDGDGIVLLDYKTNRINRDRPFEEEADRLRETYRDQIRIYEAALEEIKERPVKKAYLYLFDAEKTVDMKE